MARRHNATGRSRSSGLVKGMSFELVGDKELENAFLQLPKAAAKQTLVKVLKSAALPVAVDAARNAPRGPGIGPHLADSIAISTQLKRTQRSHRIKAGGAEVFIGPRVPHAHLVEFGTGPRYLPNGKYVGHMPPNSFMRRAWDANKEKVLEIMRQEIWNELKKTARMLRRRAEGYARKLNK